MGDPGRPPGHDYSVAPTWITRMPILVDIAAERIGIALAWLSVESD
jgi:hypothetical protein